MLDFSVDGVITVGGNSVVTHGSPTATLKKHVLDALQSGINLGKIDKVVLVAGIYGEQDSTTVLTITKPSSDQVNVSCNITASTSYTITAIRLYSGTNIYFEIGGLNQAVNTGTVVNVSVTITVQLVPTLTGDLSGATISIQNITPYIADTLAGTSRLAELKINTININLPYSTSGTLQVSRPSDTELNVSKSFVVSTAGTLTKVYLVGGGTTPATLLEFTLSKSYGANLTLTVSFKFTT